MEKAQSLSLLKPIPQSTKTIDIKHLEPGDLIFEWDGKRWGHAAICSAASGGGAFPGHSVFRNLEPQAPGVRETSLLLHPDQYRILRCKYKRLRDDAAALAQLWAPYLIPYSRDRLDTALLMDAQPVNAPGGLVAKHRVLFEQVGKFRAIKYA